jgi:hypothetical protein
MRGDERVRAGAGNHEGWGRVPTPQKRADELGPSGFIGVTAIASSTALVGDYSGSAKRFLPTAAQSK